MKIFIDTNRNLGKISKNIYGQFAEHLGNGIYGGLYVGTDSTIPNVDGIRTDVVEALKRIKVPVIRWPGGSFSEKYHWKDAVGPKERRKPVVNTSWGGVVEDNSFGTHEFFRLCELVGCAPYLAANITSGSVRELEEWVDYVTNPAGSSMAQLRRENGREEPWQLPYVGIGNESWSMRPEFYSDRFQLFASGIHAGNVKELKKIACGPNGADYNWTDTLVRMTGRRVMDGLSLHYYTMPGYYKTDEYPEEEKHTALDFTKEGYYRTLRRALYMDELLRMHGSMMDRYDPERKIELVVDEWGTWHQPETGTNQSFLYQQNTMRDAIVAGVTLNIFNGYCERVKMANIAQMVNVLQAMIFTRDEEIVLTPTYYVFELYKVHQEAMKVECYVQKELVGPEEAKVPSVSVSASEDENGVLHATIVNLDPESEKELDCFLDGADYILVSGRYLCGEMHSCNSFAEKDNVVVQEIAEIPISDNRFTLRLPACSVTMLTIRKKEID